jgi:hypothetical protein
MDGGSTRKPTYDLATHVSYSSCDGVMYPPWVADDAVYDGGGAAGLDSARFGSYPPAPFEFEAPPPAAAFFIAFALTFFFLFTERPPTTGARSTGSRLCFFPIAFVVQIPQDAILQEATRAGVWW